MYKVFVLVMVFVIVFCDARRNHRKRQALGGVYAHGSSKLANHKVHQTFAARNGSSDPEVNKKSGRLARYIVHNSNWVSMATVSRLGDWTGLPFVNVKSMVDGPVSQSTGIPYFYMTQLDDTVKDLMQNNKASIVMSMEQEGYCSENNLDPEDPDCRKVSMLGEVIKLQPGSEEYKFAKDALFERHPNMKNWSEEDGYFVTKFKIQDVVVADRDEYNGKCVPLDVYYSTDPQQGPDY